MLGERHTDNKE